MSADFEKPTHEAMRENAAERQAHYFLGDKLEPFSLGRQLALQRVGTTGSELENALLLIFLCSTPAEIIDRLTRDFAGITEFRRLMERWGEEKGLSIGAELVEGRFVYSSETTRKLVAKANEIWEETYASSFKPKGSAPDDLPDPNASSRDSQPTTRRKSRQSSRP